MMNNRLKCILFFFLFVDWRHGCVCGHRRLKLPKNNVIVTKYKAYEANEWILSSKKSEKMRNISINSIETTTTILTERETGPTGPIAVVTTSKMYGHMLAVSIRSKWISFSIAMRRHQWFILFIWMINWNCCAASLPQNRINNNTVEIFGKSIEWMPLSVVNSHCAVEFCVSITNFLPFSPSHSTRFDSRYSSIWWGFITGTRQMECQQFIRFVYQ